MTMSFVVIQHFTHRPPAINFRWWVQWFGHIPAVGLPIVASISSGAGRGSQEEPLAWTR
jgi:hypothetical protein